MNQRHLFIGVLYAFLVLIVQGATAQNAPFPQYNGDKFALIDAKTMKSLTPHKYESIGTFHDGLALSTFRSEAGKLQYTFLNDVGKEVVPATPNRLFEFVEGRARFRQGDRFGYLDTKGKAIVPARYVEARAYKNGRAFVRDEEKHPMFIDEQGNAVVRFQEDFNYVEDFNDGLVLAGTCDNLESKSLDYPDPSFKHTGTLGFYDKQGKQVLGLKAINSDLNYASNFEKGTAIVAFINPNFDVNMPSIYGVIDAKGKMVLPLQYTHIERKKDGTLLLQQYEQTTFVTNYGLADGAGKLLMPCEYTFIFDAIGDYHIMQKHKLEVPNAAEYEPYPDRYGITDLNGKVLVQPTYKDIYLHQNGNFLALDSVYIDKADEITGYQKSVQYYTYKNVAGKTLASMVELQKVQIYEEINDTSPEGGIEYRSGDLVPITFHNKWALMRNETHEIATDFYDEIAPFTTYPKGERLAYRDGKKWSYLNEHLQPATGVKTIYDYASNFGEASYAPVKKDKKWALINKSEQVVTPYAFDSIIPAIVRLKIDSEKQLQQLKEYGYNFAVENIRTTYLPTGYFIAQKGSQWGIINWDGQTILPFQYEKIVDAFYNYVIISKQDKIGVVDYAGKELIPIQYAKLKVVNDLVYAYQNGKEGLFDLQHKVIAPAIYDTIFEPNQNFIRVVKDKKTGYLDYVGKEVLPAIYDEVNGYLGRTKYMILIQNGKFGVADANLKLFIPCEYDSLQAEEWKKYIVVKKNNLYGLLDTAGRIAHPIQYEYIENLENDNYSNLPRIMMAKRNKKWGIIDTTGRAIVPFEYDNMKFNYENKEAIVSKKEKWGVIKNNGQIIVPFKYDEMGTIYQDIPLMGIKKKGKWGYLDRKGKEAILPQYQDAASFSGVLSEDGISSNFYARVKKGKYWGVIDERGKTIIPFQFDMIDPLPYINTLPITVWRTGTQERITFKNEPYKGE